MIAQSLYSPRPFIGRYAFASLPSAALFAAGTQADVSDIGQAGSCWMSDGTSWRPLNGHLVLGITAIPFVLPSSGSIANNGALTLTTALDKTYIACYMYFPVNAIAAGVAAGFYYVVMSSTTVGTIYNNPYSSGQPSIPTSPTAFATTGPGAYTQTTGADITALSYTIKGGTLGTNGGLRKTQAIGHNSSTNSKILKHGFGGGTYRQYSNSTSGHLSGMFQNTIWLAGIASVQNSPALVNLGVSTGLANNNNWINSGINTANDQTFTVTMQLATATDFIIAHGLTLELLRP